MSCRARSEEGISLTAAVARGLMSQSEPIRESLTSLVVPLDIKQDRELDACSCWFMELAQR